LGNAGSQSLGAGANATMMNEGGAIWQKLTQGSIRKMDDVRWQRNS